MVLATTLIVFNETISNHKPNLKNWCYVGVVVHGWYLLQSQNYTTWELPQSEDSFL